MATPDYDEFGLFHENAAEAGLEWTGAPTVERVAVTLDDGRVIRGLRWGTTPPEIVFLHGGGQNAHTWDTVALALDRPLLAIDLPGHGHSDGTAPATAISPRSLAEDMAVVVAELAPDAALVVGMSLGGMTAMELAVVAPALVRKLMMVDVTPGADKEKASDVLAFLAGPESFASFDEILERTVLFNPTRSETSLRRGILHNAVEQPDGSWVWRHQRGGAADMVERRDGDLDFSRLWDDLASIEVPVQLVVGDRSPVVDEEDQASFRQRQPDAQILTVDDAGHSIQGDQPLELARLIEAFLDA
ncbi:alpha/beta fold hydrolase [Actinospongicola halichondriae]|uniref:alpha/beta fold hydrolase n=1 Tax=Actinospongicola halichondriae TaxID=3236844 RepID=UPI003D47FDDF